MFVPTRLTAFSSLTRASRHTSGPRTSGRTATTSESTRLVAERPGGPRVVALAARGAVVTQLETNGGSSSGDGARRTVPENPKYVTTVGGYHLSHDRLLSDQMLAFIVRLPGRP